MAPINFVRGGQKKRETGMLHTIAEVQDPND